MHRAALSLALVAAACARAPRDQKAIEDRPSMAVPTELPRGGGPPSIAGGLSVLASARCDRELRCGRVGDERAFADVAACTRIMMQRHGDDDAAARCQSTALLRCADRLRNAPCDASEPTSDDCVCAANAGIGGPAVDAREEIAIARCRRAEACGAPIDSFDACVTREETALDRFRPAACTNVDAAKLRGCVDAIALSACASGNLPPACDARGVCANGGAR